MKLFKRRQNTTTTSVVPPEIQAYSQAEHRERMGIAALVGFISLILTLIIVFGMFIGGRWLYQKVASKKAKPSNTTAVEPIDSKGEKQTQKASSASSAETSATSASRPAQQSENAANTPQPLPATPAQAPVTTTDNTLPRTGPDLDL